MFEESSQIARGADTTNPIPPPSRSYPLSSVLKSGLIHLLSPFLNNIFKVLSICPFFYS